MADLERWKLEMCEVEQAAVRAASKALLEQHTPPSWQANDESDATYVKMLAGMFERGDVPSKGAMGERMRRWKEAHPERAEELEKSVGGTASNRKKEFRLQWARLQLESKAKLKVHTEECTEIDESIGTYEPLDVIIKKEGGQNNPRAIAAGVQYAKHAIESGGQFLLYNEFTKRTDVLYIKKSKRESFSRMWKTVTQESFESHAGKKSASHLQLFRRRQRRHQRGRQIVPFRRPRKNRRTTHRDLLQIRRDQTQCR